MKSFLKEYFIELIASGMALIGLLLVAGKVNFLQLLKQGLFQLQALIASIFHSLSHFQLQITPGDLLGGILISLALVSVHRRLHFRMAKKLIWISNSCPKCGWDKHRVHRFRRDRVFSAILGLPLHRYGCSNPACNWTGLFYGKPHPKKMESGKEAYLNKQPA